MHCGNGMAQPPLQGWFNGNQWQYVPMPLSLSKGSLPTYHVVATVVRSRIGLGKIEAIPRSAKKE